jgi:hypothetical protein
VLDHEHAVVAGGKLGDQLAERRDVRCVQPDARLVEHEQGVVQVRAERRRQRHALGLAAGERSRLAIERQVAEPDALEVREPRQELGAREAALIGLALDALERGARAAHFEFVPLCDVRARHHERERGLAEAAALAGVTRVVGAVAREQHAHVHLVGAPLEPFEPAEQAAQVTVAVAVQQERALGLAELGVRHVHWDSVAAAELAELGALPGGGGAAPGADRALRQRATRIGDDLVPVDADGATEAAAGGAGAERGLVGEEAHARLAERARALGAAAAAP